MIRAVLVSIIFGLGVSLPASAAWQEFLDPKDINLMGEMIGQHAACPEATASSYGKMIERAREQLRALII